ncbi:uncharacterized protein TNCV_1976131 [Trichonephila clavipes]|nr:uncharacterized protein TNCV_1976131 [Trichonephila clavipes]
MWVPSRAHCSQQFLTAHSERSTWPATRRVYQLAVFIPMIRPLSNSLNCEKCLLARLPGMFRLPKSFYNRRGSEREESWCGHPESLQPRCSSNRVVRPKSVIKIVSESASIRRACAYISRRFSCVFWSGFFFETQSAFLIGLESAEGYPLAVDDFPKRGKFPKNIPNHDVFMGTLPSSRRGKRVTLFGGVRDAPRNSFSCKQQQGKYKNYSCNP